MKSSRRNSRIVGTIALALVCLTLAAVPASASIDQMGLESGIEAEAPLGSRLVDMVSSWGNGLLDFLQELGSIFAGQSGSQILD